MKIMHFRLAYFFILPIFFTSVLNAQSSKDSIELTFEEQYEMNIRKSRINGVYIPKNLDEAFQELKALSSREALQKFSRGEEQLVARKLHFGIGRWMIYNWNFYEGSRFSHFLKTSGLSHPDDMAQFVIISFHRYLNAKPLESASLIQNLQTKRIEETLSKIDTLKIIKREREN